MFNMEVDTALAQAAARYGADPDALRLALEHESADELARVLPLDQTTAEERMARVRRALTVQTDVGAGCKLLTDDVQAELIAAIKAF